MLQTATNQWECHRLCVYVYWDYATKKWALVPDFLWVYQTTSNIVHTWKILASVFHYIMDYLRLWLLHYEEFIATASLQMRCLTCSTLRFGKYESKSNVKWQFGSSLGSCRAERYGCAKASSAVILLDGLKSSIFSAKSQAMAVVCGNLEASGFRSCPNKALCMRNRASGLCKNDRSDWSGVPKSSVISFKWLTGCSCRDWVGNKGCPVSISTKMQPTDHMSTEALYDLLPRRSSGARYGLVTTYSVRKSSSHEVRARPKSQILSKQSLQLMRILLGLRSRCRMLAEWIYLSPRRSWYKRNWQWYSSSFVVLTTSWRSVSMSSFAI